MCCQEHNAIDDLCKCRHQQEDAEAEEVEEFQLIDKLQQFGVNAGATARFAFMTVLLSAREQC